MEKEAFGRAELVHSAIGHLTFIENATGSPEYIMFFAMKTIHGNYVDIMNLGLQKAIQATIAQYCKSEIPRLEEEFKKI